MTDDGVAVASFGRFFDIVTTILRGSNGGRPISDVVGGDDINGGISGQAGISGDDTSPHRISTTFGWRGGNGKGTGSKKLLGSIKKIGAASIKYVFRIDDFSW